MKRTENITDQYYEALTMAFWMHIISYMLVNKVTFLFMYKLFKINSLEFVEFSNVTNETTLLRQKWLAIEKKILFTFDEFTSRI